MTKPDTLPLRHPQLYRPKPGVVETDLGDELVLLDPQTGGMSTLNRSGRVLWQALPGTVSERY